LLAYPKIFVNDRTQQLMVHPAIRSGALDDLYLSPLEYSPGSPGGFAQLQLAKNESREIGDASVRFLGFNLEAEGNALVNMSAGRPVAIGAVLEVTRRLHGEWSRSTA
jgi:hypothetical protein